MIQFIQAGKMGFTGRLQKAGRKADPSAAIVDSQSVKTTEKGGLSAVMMRARK